MVTKISIVVIEIMKERAVVNNLGVIFSFQVKRTQSDMGAE